MKQATATAADSALLRHHRHLNGLLARARRRMLANPCHQHDGPNTLFYLDPPYVRSTRTANHGYAHEMTDSQHDELITWCLQALGCVLLSGYESELYAPLLAAGWHRRRLRVASHASGGLQRKAGENGRTECLWLNPKAAAATPRLFDLLDAETPKKEAA